MIKFRVFDLQTKRFTNTPCYVSDNGDVLVPIDPYGVDMSCKLKMRHNPLLTFAGLFTGIQDKNKVDIYMGDIVDFTLPYQTSDIYWDVSPRDNRQGYSSQDGFTGTVTFNKKYMQFYVEDIKFKKGLEDPDYCFVRSKESWDKKMLDYFFSVKSRSLCSVDYPIITGNIYEKEKV